MEHRSISLQELKIFLNIKDKSGWRTNRQISDETGIPLRTVSLKTRKFLDLGVLELANIFPGNRFKYTGNINRKNADYISSLKRAAEVFSQELKVSNG